MAEHEGTCSKDHGGLFCDGDFRARKSSILPESMWNDDKYKYLRELTGKVEWLRPKEIEKYPKFYVHGTSRFDVKQMALGDCWFLASLAEVAEHPKLLSRVAPQCKKYLEDCEDAENSVSPVVTECRVFESTNYDGKFHFRFWKEGAWRKVVIDDLLPTVDRKLIFAQESTEKEFWCPLIEKAYAKLEGSYAALHGGSHSKALKNLTGAGSRDYYFDYEEFGRIIEILTEAQRPKALVVFASRPFEGKYKPEVIPETIVWHHSYSLTQFFAEEEEKWLKLRNPWGIGWGEWLGKGSDAYMKKCDGETQARLGYVKGEDGEFYIPLKEAKNYFDFFTICSVDSIDTACDEELERAFAG